MTLRALTIDRSSDAQWHEAFIRYVPQIFPRANFRRPHDLAGWPEGYRSYAIADGSEIVANASVQTMQLVLHGQELRGLQLGAVGVVPEWRGKGLQREIMPRVLADALPGDLMFLFANDSVLEFYPRYGFRRLREHVYHAAVDASPAEAGLRQLSLGNEADRSVLSRLAARALPVTELFGARDYGSVLLWYWANYYPHCFHYHEQHEVIVIGEQTGDRLLIHDLCADHAIDLMDYVPGLITNPIRFVEFGFTPEKLWPTAEPAHEYTDSPLFVRGDFDFPSKPFKYPLLAQT